MITQIIFIILCAIGIINSIYLIKKRITKKPLVCPLKGDCNFVTQSKWSKTLGINNDILGLLFYCILLIILFISLNTIILILTIIGALFSLFLLYVQQFKIKQYCFYCLISTFSSIFLLVLTFFL